MAGYKKIYTSQTDYLYDLAKSQQYFSDEQYAKQVEQANGDNYLAFVATYKDNLPSGFNQTEFDKLGDDDKLAYMVWKADKDTTSESYKQNEAYFNQVFEKIKNDEIYNSLNCFEKTLATVGGWFGSLGLGVYGLGEGLLDAASLIGGGIVGGIEYLATGSDQILDDTIDFIGKDVTGYNAAQQALTEFRQAYTFENKQQWMGAINDVFGAIGQMAPMLVTGGASAAVKAIGTAAYYVGMAGNTAEQAVVANPDIEYWKLLAYTGAVTGVEALTEWGSGKIFGEGLIGLKGYNPKQISGGMFKTILHNMGTEAAEEAVSEIFGGILEYYLVTEDRESLPTLEKVLYAALIGGITGGVLAGGRIALTPRMSVTSDGQVKYNKNLTTEERESAKKLGLRKSWAVQSLLQQSSDALNRVDEVTKLQTKYGNLSLDQIKTQHGAEYQKAVKVDTETKTQQAKSFLSLAKLMNEIGEQNFKEAVDLLNGAVDDAKRMADNYINHRAEGNKKASEVFAANYPNRSFTPSTIPSKTNQTLAEAIRKAFPNINVVFGTFGDKDGDPIRAINGTETYLFVDENFAAKNGTQALVESVRYQLADQLMSEMEMLDKSEVDGLVKLFTDADVPYSKLTKEQKRTIAQILCFDVVNTRKVFRNSPKTHKKIFKYFTDQSEYVKKFGRQTEANKIRYHDLLSIRNMYIQNIVDTIGNMEDARAIAKEYDLSEEELQTKIIDKMMTTNANDVIKLTKLQQVKEACQKRDAFNELYNSRVDNTEDFDFDRMYDANYYSPDFVETVSQNNADFKQALQEYILTKHGIAFVDKTEFDIACNNMLSVEMVEQFSKDFLTKEFLDTNPSYADKKAAVVEAIYMLSQTGADLDGDSVIVTDTKIKGTGKLKFLKVKSDERNNIYNDQQQRRPSESAREQVGNVVTKSTTIANKVTIDQIDESSYNDRQKEMTGYAEKEYGVKLHFFEGSAVLVGYDINTDYGLNGFIYGDSDVYIRYDDTLSESVIERILLHEGTHKLISENKYAYERLRDDLRETVKNFDTLLNEYKSNDMYGLIYDSESDIIEEVVVDICCGRITNVEWRTNAYDGIQKIFNFYRDVSHIMYNIEQSFFDKNKTLSQQNVREKMRPHIMSNKTATWTKERLDKLIDRNTSSDNPNRVEAYASYINPHDFVAATTSTARERSTIRMQMRDYDYLGNLADISETPYLRINPSTMEIVGHEGRHRMWAMSDAGITEAAVVIYFDTTDIATSFFKNNVDVSNRIYEFVTFKGQTDYNGFGGKENQAFVTFRDMIPLNESHRTDLEKTFVKGFEFKEGPKIRFAKDPKQQNKQETSMQQKINNADTPKQIADVITSIIENAPTEISATKGYGDEGTRLYKKTSDDMRRKYASLWSKITQDNYDAVRNELVKSDYEYADEALLIFDRFTRAYSQLSTKFDAETKEKILKNASKKQTIAAISQGLQSAELANEHSFGEISAKFEEDGYKVKVSDQTVAQYVPEMADKKGFVKRLDEEISNIETQLKSAETDLDAAVLNDKLDKTIEKRIVIAEGTNEEIMDWVIKNEDIVTKASKLQKEVFEQMVEKGERAEKEGKKAITILVDEKTGLPKPFPKATKIIENSVKKLKSFRMWSMLTSPVSWVRNWVGNSGMTALDSMTNSLEKFISSKQPKMTEADLAKLEKQYKELASKEKPTDADKVKMAQISNQMERYYDFKFVETKASKELRTQIANDYKDVIQQILNGEDVKYESSAEKAAAITRAERKITQASQNANLGQKLWAACQSMTDWGLNTGRFGDNAVVVNSLVKNFANMVESNKAYLLKSLKTEYGNDGRGMSDARKKLVEKALKSQKSIDIVNAMSKYDVSMFMDSCKQRTFEQYFKNSNWLSQWASNLSRKHPIAASLTSLVLPFPKVAANILSMAYKYSPLGFLSAARQWSVVKQMDAEGYAGVRDAFARAKAGRTTAQATVGSFMMLAGLILAALGVVDIDEDDYLGPSLKMGDFKISLSNLAPSMTTFSVGSAMLWAWKNDKSATLQALNVLYDNTLLGNIENVFKYGSPDKYIENLSINYFSQYVPAMLKLFTKFTTNQEMIDKSGSYWEKLGKTFASGIPFVANALPKKINPYTGEVLTGTGSQNVFFNFIEALSPLDFRSTSKPATQKEAERLGTESSGLSGTFKVNDIEYTVDKVTYGKYRANYIEENFEKILSGKQKVTVEDENGKRITTTYDKLTDKQKKNVINRLYTDATSMTKIKWWTDQGNTYVVTDRDLYNEYRKMFSNIVYKKNWSKSKFVES